MSHWMFNCKDVSQRVSESMDRSLPLHHRMMIKIHLMMCSLCSRYENQLELMRKALSRVEADDAPDLITPLATRKAAAFRPRLSQFWPLCC